MMYGNIFVMEVMVDFEYMFEVINYQMFEVQFWCDMQVYVEIQCVMVGDKWMCSGIVRDYLYYRCFNFYKVVVYYELVNIREDLRVYFKGVVGFIVGDEIEIMLMIVCFLIL